LFEVRNEATVALKLPIPPIIPPPKFNIFVNLSCLALAISFIKFFVLGAFQLKPGCLK
jgi:hypothetical protein